MRPNGDDIRRLTSDVSVERNPKFSPDGRKIVFVSDRSSVNSLYILDIASGEELGPVGSSGADYPDWSPDGERIAFILDDLLYDMNPDGSDQRLLFDLMADYGYSIGHPAYSADGRYILFDYGWMFGGGIGRCNADGSDCRVVMDDLIGFPSPAPDELNVAVRTLWPCDRARIGDVVSSEIYIIPWRGYVGEQEDQDTCTYGVRVTPEDEPHASNPRWGPGFIVYESGQLNSDIKAIEAVGTTSCSITDGPFDDRNPAWSPKGTVIP
jgi:Tol biopolymer transport system component